MTFCGSRSVPSPLRHARSTASSLRRAPRKSAVMMARLLRMLVLAATGAVNGAEIRPGRFVVPMRTFSDLLKIPLEPPDVNPTVHSTREEEGVVIEDVSWPSIDGDIVP